MGGPVSGEESPKVGENIFSDAEFSGAESSAVPVSPFGNHNVAIIQIQLIHNT